MKGRTKKYQDYLDNKKQIHMDNREQRAAKPSKFDFFNEDNLYHVEIYEDVVFIASEAQRQMLKDHWKNPLLLAGAISKIISTVGAKTELSDGRVLNPRELKDYVTPLYGELLGKFRAAKEAK